MILPDFILPNNINLNFGYSGMDQLKLCLDPEHFQSYPYPIHYNHNSRGYRDVEWPDNDLDQAVWCIGDSFTVGIGSPVNHTWPFLLSQRLASRTINVSMDGASNNWIAKKAISLIKQIQPRIVILHWSYIERREHSPGRNAHRNWAIFYNSVKDPSWPECPTLVDAVNLPEHIYKEITDGFKFPLDTYLNDHSLRIHCSRDGVEQDIINTWQCINSVEDISKQFNVKVIHSFIPSFIFPTIQSKFWNAPESTDIQYVPELQRLDLARDGHHYDIITAQYFVDQLIEKIKSNNGQVS